MYSADIELRNRLRAQVRFAGREPNRLRTQEYKSLHDDTRSTTEVKYFEMWKFTLVLLAVAFSTVQGMVARERIDVYTLILHIYYRVSTRRRIMGSVDNRASATTTARS